MQHSNHCPNCRNKYLKPFMHGEIEIDACVKCAGLWFERHELSHVIEDYDQAFPRAGMIVKTLGERIGTSKHDCPHCEESMAEYRYDDKIDLDLDVCEECHGIWIEHKQLDLIKVAHQSAEAMEYVHQDKNFGHWIFQILSQLPVEFNFPPRRFPIVTVLLILTNLIVFVLTLFVLDPEKVIFTYSLYPNQAGSADWFVSLLTMQFLHGGYLHIFGNMYLLYILGDNVEDVLGKFSFLALYLVGGICAGILYSAVNINSGSPVVGASGSVAAVIGVYLVLFRKAYLTFMVVVFQFKLPAAGYIGVWIAINVVMAVSGSESTIAWWAHIGGFTVGAAFGVLTYNYYLDRYPLLRLINRRIRETPVGSGVVR